jgi:hypothetical protein
MPISPLIQRYDPYGELQRQAEMGYLRGREMGDNRDLTIADLLTPEEKQSNLQWLANQGATGLGSIAYGLDTLGAGVRGLLAGKPGSVFGNAEERVSGRDLLREYGLIGDEDTYANFAGGLLTEIVTDPLSYINPLAWLGSGAKTAVGKAAGKSGLLRTLRATTDEMIESGGQFAGKKLGPRGIMKEATPQDFITHLEKKAPGFNADKAANDFYDAYTMSGGKLSKEEALKQVMASDFGGGIPFTDRFSGSFNIPGVNMARAGDTLERFVGEGNLLSGAAARMGSLFNTDVQDVYSRNLQQTKAAQKAARISTRNASIAREAESEAFNLVAKKAMDATFETPQGLMGFNDPAIREAINAAVEDPLWFSRNADLPAVQAIAKTPAWQDFIQYAKDYAARARKQVAEAGGAPQGFESVNWKARDYMKLLGAGEDDSLGFIARQRAEFANPDLPSAALDKTGRSYTSDSKAFNTAASRKRAESMDIPQWLMNAMTRGERGVALREALEEAGDKEVKRILDDAYRQAASEGYRTNVTDDLYSGFLKSKIDPTTPEYQAALLKDKGLIAEGQLPVYVKQFERAGQQKAKQLYVEMADRIRQLDRQFGDKDVGFFDSDIIQNINKNIEGTAKSRANISAAYRLLQDPKLRMLIPGKPGSVEGGGVKSLSKALGELGLDKKSQQARQILRRYGIKSPNNLSVDEEALKTITQLVERPQVPEAVGGMLQGLDTFTNAWKVGALTFPSYMTRNLYSGYASNLMAGGGAPADFMAALRQSFSGNNGPLLRRLRNIPRYKNLADDAERVARFEADVAAHGVISGNINDQIARPAERVFPGPVKEAVANSEPRTLQEKAGDLLGVRGVFPLFKDKRLKSKQHGKLLRGFEKGNELIEDTLRVGSFINQLRKGATPSVAADMVRKLNVDYSPQAFTNFEQSVLKRAFPFYSFQRGILPSIRDNLLERPGGGMTQMIRLVNRGTEPSDESFVPERLRRQVSIPLYESGDNAVRLSNIDLPFSGLFNYFTPGTNVLDTARNTLGNVAGDMHPAVKYLIEQATGRQLYSGARLKDLYSSLAEATGGGAYAREAEQAFRNLIPFGSRGLSLASQIMDDRKTPLERAYQIPLGVLTGSRFTAYDPLDAKEMFTRKKIQELLRDTEGTRAFENIYVPEGDLDKLSERDQQLYLLYRTIQSDVQKRARARKQAEAANMLMPN